MILALAEVARNTNSAAAEPDPGKRNDMKKGKTLCFAFLKLIRHIR